jgi:hypothetical protein
MEESTNLVFETRFIENAGAFGYVFGNLKVGLIEKGTNAVQACTVRTDGSWPVPMGMRQKSYIRRS